MKKEINKYIAIYRVGQLGDTLIALPAIEAIRARYPEHNFVLITDKHPKSKGYISAWDILESTDFFEKVIFYEPKQRSLSLIKTIYCLLKEVRKFKVDHMFVLAPMRGRMGVIRDRLFFKCFAGAKNYSDGGVFKYAYKNGGGKLPRIEEEWLRLLRIVDNDVVDLSYRIPIKANAEKKINRLFKDLGYFNHTNLVALGIGSKMPVKRWPIERYKELCDRFFATFQNIRFVLLGGIEDSEDGEMLSGSLGERCVSFTGKLSINESAALLKKCKLFIGNDTGTMHLAALVGTPCVALFSARDYPGKWEPYGDQHVILRRETECSGCMLEQCIEHDNKCIKKISVDSVFEIAKEKL